MLDVCRMNRLGADDPMDRHRNPKVRRPSRAYDKEMAKFIALMWTASEHSDEDNLQRAQLRGIEWIGWPLFLSQPIVAVLLYFYDWRWILAGVVCRVM